MCAMDLLAILISATVDKYSMYNFWLFFVRIQSTVDAFSSILETESIFILDASLFCQL